MVMLNKNVLPGASRIATKLLGEIQQSHFDKQSCILAACLAGNLDEVTGHVFGVETKMNMEGVTGEGKLPAAGGEGNMEGLKRGKEGKLTRNVVVEDFEMMRVLGKGVAAKVCLFSTCLPLVLTYCY
jgi:hypothetical protein